MYGTRALRKVGWRRRLKIMLKEELHNLYSAKSKLEGWSGRKCSTHGTKLVAVYIFRCQCLCTECKGQWVINLPHSDSYRQHVLVAILSLWRPEFDPTPVRVRYVMGKLGTGSSPGVSIVPCLYHSTTLRSHLSFIYNQSYVSNWQRTSLSWFIYWKYCVLCRSVMVKDGQTHEDKMLD
jgi:hypothetical protein